MDPPQTFPFASRDDIWRVQSDIAKVQQTQVEHSERLLRLERRLDDDARMKSVWGNSSPFPGILSGTPQQAPLNQPPVEAFSGFDDQSTNLIGSLHLDADDEPRRIGATSRANSVRFDESANQGHWSQPSRSSFELIPRSGSSLGAHPIERSYSHKSDGRQSSGGHSVHSLQSGRANSLGIDAFSSLRRAESPPQAPGFAPGLLLLGNIPSIIRCWLNTNFRHDTLLYAAVCTGSCKSWLDQRFVDHLGYSDQVRDAVNGSKMIKLPLYLSEAVTRGTPSRSSSPAPQLPTLTVDFTIFAEQDGNPRAIGIFVGSDVLRAKNAEISFSSNSILIYDDENCKLSVPMVRPEDEGAFSELKLINRPLEQFSHSFSTSKGQSIDKSLNGTRPARFLGLQQAESGDGEVAAAPALPNPPQNGDQVLRDNGEADISHSRATAVSDNQAVIEGLGSPARFSKPGEPLSSPTARSASGNPAIWGNWRRDSEGATQAEWPKTTSSSYQRREQGIKVLRPLKPASRTVSGAQPSSGSASPRLGQSRFFEEGRTRTSSESLDSSKQARMGAAGAQGKETTSQKPKSVNPAGAASAFPWVSGHPK